MMRMTEGRNAQKEAETLTKWVVFLQNKDFGDKMFNRTQRKKISN